MRQMRFEEVAMRIGIDIRHLTDPQPAGVGGYTRALLEALFRLDQTNEYVLFASGTPSTLKRLPKFDAPNVKMISYPVPNKLLNALMLVTGGPTLEWHLDPEIVPDVWFFPNLNFISTNLPYAIMAHDLSYKIFPEFFTWKSRLWHKAVRPDRTFSGAAQIVCPSTSTKQDLMQTYKIDGDKIQVTSLAVSPPPTPPNLPSVRGGGASISKSAPLLFKEGLRGGWPKRFILSLATLEPRKNQISIIEAYETYRDQTHDEIHLVIGGGAGWKSKPILKAAKKSKYAKEIHLIGYIDENQKAELYQQAQVFVFPSFYEGFGLPVLEAMTYGCPIITSHTSSLPELVGDSGLLVDPYNVNDITAAIKLILSSDQLRSDLIKRGHKRATDFHWDETAKQTLDVLQKLV